ncbi:MAG: T9SS type A sorting domain-containing protein [Chitinophagales bacterium]
MKNYSSILISFAIVFTFSSTVAFSQLPNVFPVNDHLQYNGNPGLVSMSITLGNNGDNDYPGGLLGMYLSLDTLLNPLQDSLIFSFSGPLVLAGDTANFSVNAPFCEELIFQEFPGYVFIGNPFYFLYDLDYLDFNPESNENDNVGVFQPPLTMDCATGVYETGLRQFAAYPNPNNGVFIITFPTEPPNDEIIIIQNLLTQSTQSIQMSGHENEKSIDCSFLPDGIYLLKLFSNGHYYQQKMVIER